MQGFPTKIDYTGAADTGTISAAEANSLFTESENLILSALSALDANNLYQFAEAVAQYATGGDFFTEHGTSAADAYVLTPIGSRKAPPTYVDGARYRFRVTNANTGATTLKLFGLSALSVKKNSGADALVAGDFAAGAIVEVVYQNALGEFWVTRGVSQQAVNYVGEVRHGFFTAAPAGWLFATGSIGSAASGATRRANADTLDLYTVLWNACADAEAPVAGGRGGSAAADFAANKALTMPDVRGRALVGTDNLGGSAANRITSASTGGVKSTVIGGTGGAQTHTLVAAEMPSHTHTVTAPASYSYNVAAGGSDNAAHTSGTRTTSSAGSDAAHSNTQPWLAIPIIICYIA